MKEFWNERYRAEAFAFGEEPNEYLKAKLPLIETGKILFPAEGEGRNAVFAAQLGWDVSAFDLAEEGKKKAEELATKHHVTIDYTVGGVTETNYSSESFDALALIYAHFPAHTRAEYHQYLASVVKKNGIIILEGFSKKHLEYNTANPKAGGPKDLAMLFSIEEIQTEFADFEIIELKQEDLELNEGLYHNGMSSVIRFIGKKRF